MTLLDGYVIELPSNTLLLVSSVLLFSQVDIVASNSHGVEMDDMEEDLLGINPTLLLKPSML